MLNTLGRFFFRCVSVWFHDEFVVQPSLRVEDTTVGAEMVDVVVGCLGVDQNHGLCRDLGPVPIDLGDRLAR